MFTSGSQLYATFCLLRNHHYYFWPRFNYRQHAEHYDFKIIPCRIYRPNDKAKVESGIKYVKCNFFLGRTFSSGDDLDVQLKYWLNHTCNQRIHGTIRKVPREVFESEEKAKLKPLPLEEFKMSTVGSRKVYHDCHVFIDYSYYSVPFEYVGKVVDIDISKELVRIFYQTKEIAVHPRLEEKGKFSTNINHYPKEIINLACKRAIAFGVHQYQVIRRICHNGSYSLPVEFNFEEINENEYAKV